MTSPTRALPAADEGQLELSGIVAALGTAYSVQTGPRQYVRRARLDTFDRRLSAAGLTLEHQQLTSGQRLVLRRPGGASALSVPVKDPRWPALADALPAGPLRDAVASLTGIRALMVTSDERRSVRRLELRNQDAKIVARVELDEPASASGAPAKLSVRPLRGYDEQARRAGRLLAGLGPHSARPALQSVDVAQSPEPSPEAGPRVTDRSAPATELLAGALGDFLTAMRENLPGLLDDVDTEFLHDFRVAVRRTRSTLKLGRPCLPEVMRSRWEPAFKGLGDVTTPVRDLDVYELDLPRMSGWLVAADPADLEPFAVHLRRRRTAERRALVRRLGSAGFRRLLTEWQAELAGLEDGPEDVGREHLSAGQLADRSIRKAYERVARGGAAISGDSPATDLHSLRKRCKELRYALEVCAPLLAKGPRRRAVVDLKDLQDVLGRFQDSEVQRQALRGFAEEMMADGTSASAVLAMGELIGHLDAEQDRARDEFGGAFAHFARPSSQAMMHHLGGGRS
jgi:CHAD domain-containing protein